MYFLLTYFITAFFVWLVSHCYVKLFRFRQKRWKGSKKIKKKISCLIFFRYVLFSLITTFRDPTIKRHEVLKFWPGSVKIFFINFCCLSSRLKWRKDSLRVSHFLLNVTCNSVILKFSQLLFKVCFFLVLSCSNL